MADNEAEVSTDTKIETTTETKKAAPEAVTAGAPQRVSTFEKAPVEVGETQHIPEGEQPPAEDNPGDSLEEKVIEKGSAKDEPPALPELTDDQLKELWSKRFPTEQEQTEEQKKIVATAFDKRLRDLYEEQGGKYEDFVELKKIAERDLTELSKTTIVADLQKKGFNEAEINEILAEQYYQLNPDELEQGVDEEDADFEARKESVKKKVAFGKERFDAKGQRLKTQAESIINTLKSGLELKDFEAKEEMEFTAKVDELSKTMPKKLTIPLGKLNNIDLGSVEVDSFDNEVAETISTLKDTAQRKQLLFNDDGTFNEKSISDLLLRSKILDKAVREGYLSGQTKATEDAARIFPHRSPNSVGLGGSPSSRDNSGLGKIASSGAPQRMNADRR